MTLALGSLSTCAAQAGLTFETRVLEKLRHADNRAENPSFRLAYPFFMSGSSATVLKRINGAIHSELLRNPYQLEKAKSLDALVESFMKEAGERAIFEKTITVRWQSADMICLEAREFHFAGAYPDISISFVTLHIRNGQAVKLSDLIHKRFIPLFHALVERRFRDARGLSDSDDLREVGLLFQDGRFELPPTFGVDQQGLTFVWNPVPHVIGPTEVKIPASDIRKWLKRSENWTFSPAP